MQGGLKSLYYIRNNKRKVIILATILTLFIVLIYVVDFFFEPTLSTGDRLSVDESQKMQSIYCISDDAASYNSDVQSLCDSLNKRDDVYAMKASSDYFKVIIPTGIFSKEIYYLDKKDIPTYIEKTGSKLVEGRLPQNKNEVAVDTKTLKNCGCELNGTFETGETIVGLLESDFYLAVGYNESRTCETIITFSDADTVNLRSICNNTGTNLTLQFEDYEKDEIDMDDLQGQITPSVNIITIFATLLIAICVVVYLVMSFRDRYDEWCLFRSIGFSGGQIYSSVMRELLIILALSVCAATVISALLILTITSLMFEPLGLIYHVILPKTLLKLVCLIVLLFGVCQIPLASAIHKVKTIDAIEEDVY